MRLCLIAAAVLLSACQLALPVQAPEPAPVSPITGGEISVTTLKDPDGAVIAGDTAPIMPDPALPATEAPEPDEPAPVENVPSQQPPAPKSASQLACEKRGGDWVMAGTTGTQICQTPQPDAGKQCSRKSDCEGQCLARSRSCAPVSPLFGCNDVLQDNGQRVTLCIE